MIKLYRYLQPFRLAISAVLLLVFAQTMASLFLPTLMSHIVDTGILRNDVGYITRVGGVMLVVALGSAICSVGASFFSSRVSMAFGRTVRGELFRRVSSFSLHEFDQIGTATLITRTTNDVTQVQMATLLIMRMMVAAPITCVGGIIMALSLDRPLTLVLAVSVPILILSVFSIASRGIPLFRLMQIKIDRVNLVLREQLIGIRVIRAFNKTQAEEARFEGANIDLTSNAVRVNRIMALMMPLLMLIMNLTSIAIIWFGAKRIDARQMDVGSLIAFIQYAMQIMFAFLMFSFMFVIRSEERRVGKECRSRWS